jgi:hypothetical protein
VPAPEPCSELLDPDLVAFVHGGVAGMLGTSNADQMPALTRAFAVRVAPDGRTIDLFVGRAQSATCLANIAAGRPMAVLIGSPTDYRSMQMKGEAANCQEPGADDAAWLDRYWRLFEASVDQIGMPPAQSARFRCRDVVRVTFVPTALFRQTPGPGAGSPLAAGPRWT